MRQPGFRFGAIRNATLVGCVIALVAAGAARGDPRALVYDCTARHFLQVDDTGEQRSTPWTQVRMREPPQLLFVTSDGSARWGGIDFGRFQIIQRATSENGLVAIRVYHGPAQSGVVVVRIRAWETPVTFLLNDRMQTYSGTCVIR